MLKPQEIGIAVKTDEIKIAIIDDDEDDYYIISDYISEIDGHKFIIHWFKDYNSAIAQLRLKTYDLYLVDYRLGNKTGIDLLEEAAQMGCDEPIVLLTGKGSKKIDIQAMESGATDYLVKSDLNSEKLERCIRYSLDRSLFLKELKTRENRYRALFEGSKDAVFIADEKLLFIEVNQAASILTGCGIARLNTLSLYDFILDDSQKLRINHILQTHSAIADLEIRLQPENENSEIKICLLSLSFQERTGERNLVHGIIHDITNIKKSELFNLQSEKLAANERLVRMLAHEIRNPLNNISLSIENLQVAYLDDVKRENLLGILQRNSSRINQIITELLNLTKPVELVFKNYALQEIIDESLGMASDRITLQKIQVEKKFPEEELEINADKSKLVIAFTNLLINAVEAMEMGKGKLSIFLSSQNDRYVISIRDNGNGISPEYMTKLFEPFFTLKKNGMGLGLAACYSIVQSHKGAIEVESTPGKGTNFIISFNKPGVKV